MTEILMTIVGLCGGVCIGILIGVKYEASVPIKKKHSILLSKVRKECHTRQSFAYAQAEYWLDRIVYAKNGGNILTSKWTRKFMQARRIYVHYANEYQRCTGLAMTE